MLTKTKKTKVIKDVQVHDKDTGSPEVQVAILSKRIDELASHLKESRTQKIISLKTALRASFLFCRYCI